MKNKKMLKRIITLAAVVCVVFSMAVPAFATSGTDTADVAVSAVKSALSEATGTLNITNVLTIIVSAIGASILLVFFWWGLRKVIRAVMAAFKKGKLSV